ncbi:hypothetical protein K7I13_02900 [Brucepastera parasyntrophica]|uniref:hypothetical protein n=1 Tax=Brucepastera parasyntrophica TaxID=2880008 RepID=UPI002108ED99|nr:hypothetical protein [Brucepastera parasyntrophica]ULQ60277.1 hypothetical protein K7I13_02900 [Brucepastera parasyntrophica]
MEKMNNFDRKTFALILSKLKAIGPKCWTSENKDFVLYRQALLQEVQKKDDASYKAVSFLFSDEYLRSTNLSTLNLLCNAFSFWVETFVNTHQYTKATIQQNSRIGNTYFDEYEQVYRETYIQLYIQSFRQLLEKIVEEIIEEGEYKK